MQVQRHVPTSVKPTPAKQAPATPAPTTRPVAGDRLALTPGTLIDLKKIQPGQKLSIEKGKFRGHGFGGDATVTAWDGKTLDMVVNARARFLFIPIKVDVHLRFELQPDGSVRFVGERLGKKDAKNEPQDVPEKVGTALAIKSRKPGETVLEATDGSTVTLASTPKGGIHIAYDKYQITMKP